MNKCIKRILCLMLFFTIIVSIKICVSSKTDFNNTVKVGYYECYPYYFINSEGKIDGYYHEIMNVISNELNIEYEYIDIESDNALEKIKNGDVDLLFGVHGLQELRENYSYSKYHLHNENLSIYSTNDMKYGGLESLADKKLGYVEGVGSNSLALNLIQEMNINISLVKKKSAKILIQELKEGNLDAIIHISNNRDLSGYNEIFRFASGPVYIISSKENDQLINEIDLLFERSEDSEMTSIIRLHDKYFNEYFGFNKKISVFLLVLAMLGGCVACYVIYNKYSMNKRIINKKNIIVSNLSNNNYLVFYQPIIDPKTNSIKGFEALLRLKENGNIVPPNVFLKNIEEANMMDEVSVWILKQVIKDYLTLKNYNCVDNRQFYISLNLSFKEIENNKFIDDIKELFNDSHLEFNSICLEIVERFAINDLSKVQDAINKLKSVGFMVAIDDFGVEYSNLDILEKVECDIVKLDKYFIDEIETSSVKRSVIEFVSNMCKVTNKIVVCEGIETESQKDFIKSIDNNKFYIQGYFYSKPLPLEELEDFNI